MRILSDVTTPTRAQSIAIGRVVTIEHDGRVFEVRHWFHFGADACPLHHIDSVPVGPAPEGR